MESSALPQRTYDHRIKELIARSGNPNLFPQLEIPRSTAAGWIRNAPKQVVTVDLLNKTEQGLRVEFQDLTGGTPRALEGCFGMIFRLDVSVVCPGFGGQSHPIKPLAQAQPLGRGCRRY